jgi:hypothetical protein
MTPELLVSDPPVAILARLLIVNYWLEIVTRSIMVEVQTKLACRYCSQCGCSSSASASAPATMRRTRFDVAINGATAGLRAVGLRGWRVGRCGSRISTL